MTISKKNENLEKAFTHLFEVISSERFLKKEGLGNEVPFFLYPFHSANQVKVSGMIKALKAKLETHGTSILEINLYDLSIDKLKSEGDFDPILQKEPTWSNDELKEQLQALLNAEHELIPEIVRIMDSEQFDVLFITGVGLVFPYIRSHTILNNMQKVAKEKPLVMFFPGDYIHSLEYGSSLKLFGLLKNDKYYRAFNLNNYKL